MISENKVMKALEEIKGELRWLLTLVVIFALLGGLVAHGYSVRIRWIERMRDQGKLIVVAPEDFSAVRDLLKERKEDAQEKENPTP